MAHLLKNRGIHMERIQLKYGDRIVMKEGYELSYQGHAKRDAWDIQLESSHEVAWVRFYKVGSDEVIDEILVYGTDQEVDPEAL